MEKNAKGLEVMSGKGLLSKSIQEHGLSMISTDNKSWEKCKDDTIETLSAIDSFNKYKHEIDFVLLSWCPYNETEDDYLILKTIKEENLDIDFIVITSREQFGFTNSSEFWMNSEFNYDNNKFNRKIRCHYEAVDFTDMVNLVKFKEIN